MSVVDGFDAEANEIEDLLEDANPHSREGSNYLRNRLKQFRKDMHEARRAMQPTMEAVRQAVSGTDLEGDQCVVTAVAPLAELGSFASQLKSMTGGAGSYEMEFSHYERTPPAVQQQVMAAFKPKEDEE